MDHEHAAPSGSDRLNDEALQTRRRLFARVPVQVELRLDRVVAVAQAA